MSKLKTGRVFLLLLFLTLFILFGYAFSDKLSKEALPAEVSYELYLGDGRSGWNNSSAEAASDIIRFFPLSDNGTYGFVLPASWDISQLRLFLSGTDRIRIGLRQYRSGDSISLPLNETITVNSPGSPKIALILKKTGDLPVFFIHTESGTSDAIHADKTFREAGTLLMTDADGSTLFHGNLTYIRGRGNDTFLNNKKPYQIKLEDSTSLAGLRKGKTWILLANALDRSHIRNRLALDLARYSGAFSYTPYSRSIDLYLNHDYKGTYLLTEKVETGHNRLQIRDLEKELEDMNPTLDFSNLPVYGDLSCEPDARKYYKIPEEPVDLSGGYIIQSDKTVRYETEASAFVTSRGCPFTTQEPKYMSEAQMKYLSALFQQIEDALFSEDGFDPASGLHYSELLDLPSFVNRYLLAELLNDYDAQYTYYYKDSDSVDTKIYTGPVWDQDNILGVWLSRSDPSVLHLYHEYEQAEDWFWFTQASRHADFIASVKETYFRIYRPAVLILLGEETDSRGILKSIDEYAEEVRASAEMDFFRWANPLKPNLPFYNTASGESFDLQIRFMKDYLAVRLETMDSFFLHLALE